MGSSDWRASNRYPDITDFGKVLEESFKVSEEPIYKIHQYRLTNLEAPIPKDSNYEALHHLTSSDKVLGELIPRIGRYSMRLNNDSWQTLLLAIIHQQLDGSVSKKIANNIRTDFRGVLPSPYQLIEKPNGYLTRFGLSTRKQNVILDISQQILTGSLDLGQLASLSDREVMQKLTSINGIGPWTANMFLVFHLGRQDVVIPDDLGLRKAIRFNYALDELPTKSKVEELSKFWSPYRTVASWYLWRSLPRFPEPGLI
ncbi:MAG: DNA-3-methyladenine glycosylase family protein [Thermoplasmataceae archaeon]